MQAHAGWHFGRVKLAFTCRLPNGLEMSRPASSSIVSQIRFAAAGRVSSIELLGGGSFKTGSVVLASG